MKVLKTALLVFLGLFATQGLFAQMIQDPTTWTFEAKQKSGNQYDIIFHLKLKEKWHIFSIKPGGDGSLISPSFTFDKADNIKPVGTVKEKGKLITETMIGIEGKVNMYQSEVTYTQAVTIGSNKKIKGTYTYQVCNDQTCLPPKHKDFEIDVK